MDMYRRMTRCSSVEMLRGLEADAKDAFGEPPRHAMLLFALTELRLLAGLYGITSIIKKDPDVILTVSDAARAQTALVGAPGTLRVIDEKTVYLRMPATYMQSETLLLVLRNLLAAAHDRELKGEPPPTVAPPTPIPAPRATPAGPGKKAGVTVIRR
jgi:transcription-repair coupling factor (superfamily II helicase)